MWQHSGSFPHTGRFTDQSRNFIVSDNTLTLHTHTLPNLLQNRPPVITLYLPHGGAAASSKTAGGQERHWSAGAARRDPSEAADPGPRTLPGLGTRRVDTRRRRVRCGQSRGSPEQQTMATFQHSRRLKGSLPENNTVGITEAGEDQHPRLNTRRPHTGQTAKVKVHIFLASTQLALHFM